HQDRDRDREYPIAERVHTTLVPTGRRYIVAVHTRRPRSNHRAVPQFGCVTPALARTLRASQPERADDAETNISPRRFLLQPRLASRSAIIGGHRRSTATSSAFEVRRAPWL